MASAFLTFPVIAFSAGVLGCLLASSMKHEEVAYPADYVQKLINDSGVDITKAIIIVTGSTSGIGQNLAAELYRHGATVIIASRNLKKCLSVVDEIRALHPTSKGALDCFALDLGDLDTVQPFCAWFRSKYSQLTFLVNNAGVHYGDKITDTSLPIAGPQGYDEVFVTNFLGHFLLTEKLLPMITSGGRVVSTSSSYHFQADGSTLRIVDGRMPEVADASVQGMAHRKAAYGVTKLAQVLHMKYLQRRLLLEGNTSVKTVSVCPGWVRTNILPPGMLGAFLRKFAFSPQAGLLSSMGALFNKDLEGGEFVTNNIGPFIGRADFPSIAARLTRWGIRDLFVDLVALVMVVTQCNSYGLHVLNSSPESRDEQLAKELCEWSAEELRRRKYLD